MAQLALCFPLGKVEWSFRAKQHDVARQQVNTTPQSPLEVAARYVDLANRHDVASLVAMLARPCDMFGETITSEAVEWYFSQYQDVRFLITKPFQLAAGDPYTVEFEYIRSWKQGDQWVQVEAGEFMTFTTGEPLIARIGYTRPPSDPVALPEWY
mmetsp:Transcript_100996/g.253220  ORF Transcript_100996/g.253220 Transcript_100996/m.253220 type:complete len:155 (+) Transcript_100996:48-512(+)